MIRLALVLLLLPGCKKKPAVETSLQLQVRSSLPTCSEDPLFCDELDSIPDLDELEEATETNGDD